MTRMGFGLDIAPKSLDMTVKWVTRDFIDVDNYADDLYTPAAQADAVSKRFAKLSLSTKPAEKLTSSRVLGLQLAVSDEQETWKRRDGADDMSACQLLHPGIKSSAGLVVS